LLLLSACGHLLPATSDSAVAACCAETRPEVARGLETILGRVLSNQFLGRFGRSLEHEADSFTRGKNQARGRSGLETILGRVLSNQFLGRFGRSLEHEAASFTRGKNPIGAATKRGIEWGDAHACCTLTPQFFLDYYQLPTSVEPLTPRLRGYAGPH